MVTSRRFRPPIHVNRCTVRDAAESPPPPPFIVRERQPQSGLSAIAAGIFFFAFVASGHVSVVIHHVGWVTRSEKEMHRRTRCAGDSHL